MFSSAEACTPLITYNELEQATNYWNKDNILGKGGFGVVFKGFWKSTAVAIKRLGAQKGAEQQYNILEAQRQQLLRELKYLNSCRHDNILSLYGFSIGGENPCLVYQYMITGSLEDRLQCRQGTKPLEWNFRFKIAKGSARGLQFLHGMDKPLIHGDIKSANILLDQSFEPRIGDFGLAREGPLQEYTHIKVSRVYGTQPYLPEEFLRGKKLSTKVDTYSFGVVLFEIATGQRAYDSLRTHKYLKDHVEKNDCPNSDMADVKAGPDGNNLYASLMTIGKKCVSNKAKDRPEMEQVLGELDCVVLQEKNEIVKVIKLNTDDNERRVNNLEHENLNMLGQKNEHPSVMFSSTEVCTPLITYNELEQATNYWNKENILGKGGFGVVFKGIWKNTAVAIKRLGAQKGAGQQFNILEAQRQQLLRELTYLNSCRHDNILSLYGFSIGGENPCLVYQYMITGSLEDRLQCRQGTKPLEWNFRFKIATGSARGLQFLHGMDKPLIHGDIKSANILLDQSFEPRIGDFGLAREGPLQEYTHIKVSRVYGTQPYLPEEFLRGKKLSTKVDTYSFGVVLFEIATGQRAYDSSRTHKYLKDHVENYDCPNSNMADVKAGPDENNLYAYLMTIGKKCVSNKAKDRPEMEQVLGELDCVVLQEKQHSTLSESYHSQQWLNSARNNSSTGECDQLLPLISLLQSQPNHNSQNSV